MKPGAFLVNTSRGPLVDLEALRTVMEEGHLAGVGPDAFYSEEATVEQQRKGGGAGHGRAEW